MGRTSGDIDVLVPERPTDLAIGQSLRESWQRGKRSSIIVVAESGRQGHVFQLAEEIQALTAFPEGARDPGA
jgi:hypothetical protein